MPNPLRVIDAARSVADAVHERADRARPRLLHEKQVRDSASSIAANIREAYGRRKGPERNQYFRVARSSAEETDEHLSLNARQRRVSAKWYWPLHERVVAIAKMLNGLMAE